MTAPVPVSTRVDAAWQRGYETGVTDGKRVALVASAITVYTVLRRHRINPVAAGAWTLAAAVVLIVPATLLLALGLGARAGWRHWHRRAIVPMVSTRGMVELVPGKGGDDAF